MIRLFADSDLAALYSIQLKCPQAAQWRQEDYLHLAHDPGGTILVAETDDAQGPALVGFAAIHLAIDQAELRNIAVAPSHWRKGIARALFSAVLGAIRQRGARQIFLEVRTSNRPALAFYQAAGFRLLYTRRGYYRDPDEDALVMALDVTSSPNSAPVRTC